MRTTSHASMPKSALDPATETAQGRSLRLVSSPDAKVEADDSVIVTTVEEALERKDVTEGLTGEARKKAIVDVVGEPEGDYRLRGLPDAVRRETSRYWDLYVEPLITENWPEVRDTKFYGKFKIGAQKVYAPGPYIVVVLSKRRPFFVRAMNAVCRILRLPRGLITLGLSALLPLYTRLFMRRENRHIILVAAFIACVDEAFDAHLDDVPLNERGRVLKGILDGTIAPPTKSFALVCALVKALQEGLDADEREELDRAVAGCVAWGEAEVLRFQNVPDPEGLCHRGVGIRTGIDGLAWSVRRYISPAEWQWLYDVSHFIQLLDDWVDLEKDLVENVVTPVAQGRWTLKDVRAHFDETTQRFGEIAIENGETYPPYVQLARDCYAYQVKDLLQNMVNGAAD